MYYETMPLYPSIGPCREGRSCVRVPVFQEGPLDDAPPQLAQERRILLDNPCRPGECAEVLLGLDGCGNLVVCVRREGRPPCREAPRRRCPEPPRCLPEPKPRHRCGRIYGNWD